jgi:hypothetical protein
MVLLSVLVVSVVLVLEPLPLAVVFVLSKPVVPAQNQYRDSRQSDHNH